MTTPKLTQEMLAELRLHAVDRLMSSGKAHVDPKVLCALLDIAERVCVKCGGHGERRCERTDKTIDCFACGGTGWRRQA